MKSRVLIPELMDDPAIDPAEHRRALNGLRRVNKLCRTGQRLAQEILSVAKKNNRDSITVLDIGCGSGDVAAEVGRRLASQVKCKVCGWDISPTAVDCANQAWSASQNRLPTSKRSTAELQFQQADIFQTKDLKFDVVYCCLFLHHFTEHQAVQVLERMKEIAALSVLVDDLVRSRLGYVFAQIGCQLLDAGPSFVAEAWRLLEAAHADLLQMGLPEAEVVAEAMRRRR